MLGPERDTTGGARRCDRQLAIWLLACCALVFAMIVLGGVTRLTNSGLSMVEWDPIMGAVPPLSQGEWLAAFAKYQQYPEYRQVNAGMSLVEFKRIFLVEYAHRVLGRVIGLAFALPLLFFTFTRRVPRPLLPKLVILFILGGLQGLLGWYMVKSGLIDQPHVSQYRLTAHLGLALLIYAVMFWIALGLWTGPRPRSAVSKGTSQGLRLFSFAVIAVIALMILSGGFVAGTRAGFAFNSFPLMNGQWLPPGGLALEPVWRNFFENTATVQFIHRCLAATVAAVVVAFWWRARRTEVKGAAGGLLIALVVQLGLGIATLVHVVPVTLAALHQAGALVLVTLALMICHALSRPMSRPVSVDAAGCAVHI